MLLTGCMDDIEPFLRMFTDEELARECRIIDEILCIDDIMDSCLVDTVSGYETLVHDEVIRRFCAHVETVENESESVGK